MFHSLAEQNCNVMHGRNDVGGWGDGGMGVGEHMPSTFDLIFFFPNKTFLETASVQHLPLDSPLPPPPPPLNFVPTGPMTRIHIIWQYILLFKK